MRLVHRIVSAGCMVALTATAAAAQNSSVPQPPVTQTAQDLKRLTLEELSELPVTTSARRAEPLSDAAAAISVIRGEDIRRSGATSLGEALRLADALNAAQVYGPGWAIVARGFNIATANKMLVLIDGRTVYSPLFSGVFWDAQEVMLEDIERIEVTRGPGGTLWGANAVNGVVNIITKTASDTPGTLVSVAAGNELRSLASVRYGGRRGSLSYRGYGRFRATDDQWFASGSSGMDDVQFGQTGFRIDSDASRPASWTLQGDAYRTNIGLYDRDDTHVAGGNLLGRWTRRWSDATQFKAQVYYDRTTRRVQRQYRSTRDTFDLDTQQLLQFGSRHSVVVGGGFRSSRGDDLGDGPAFFFEPQVRTSTIASVFGQDTVGLSSHLALIVGAKVEHNDFTGFELQPNVRIRLTPPGRGTAWAAVSRAVRMPTRFDTDLRILNPSGRLLVTGSDTFRSETVTSFEVGYRVRSADRVSFDVTAYANDYDHLRSQEPTNLTVLPFVLANGQNARTSGLELAGNLTLARWWQTHASYRYLWKRFSRDGSSSDTSNGSNEANDPSHLLSVRTSIDLPRGFEADLQARYVSALPKPAVASYGELNARFGWSPRPRWDLSVVGQNLLHNRHQEFAAGTPRELFERSVYLRATWRF